MLCAVDQLFDIVGEQHQRLVALEGHRTKATKVLNELNSSLIKLWMTMESMGFIKVTKETSKSGGMKALKTMKAMKAMGAIKVTKETSKSGGMNALKTMKAMKAMGTMKHGAPMKVKKG